jgi:hypothetical protein
VEEKSAELDKMRNKVNQLESSSKSQTKSSPAVAKQTQTDPSPKSESSFSLAAYNAAEAANNSSKVEPRVTFDLGPASKLPSGGGGEPAIRRPVDKPPSQLPSDARQRLQEMAGLDIRRNYRKTSETYRPSQLNLTSSTANSNNNNNISGANGGGYLGNIKPGLATPTTATSPSAATTALTAGRISPTKAYPVGAVMPTTELNSHHVRSSNSNSNGGGGGGPAAAAVMRRDSRSNSRNSLVVTVQTSNNQKRPPGVSAGGGGVSSREVVMNNHPASRNAINETVLANHATRNANGTRTRTPSIERSIISNKDDQKDANKVRPKSFWGGWWKF